MSTLLVWLDDFGLATSLRFDVVPTITFESTVIVSDHPVESGADISDNARPGLQRVSLDGVISNSPRAGDATIVLTPGGVIPKPGSALMLEQPVQLEIPPMPFKFGNPVGQLVGAVSGLLSGSGNVATLQKPLSSFDRVRDAWDALDKLQKDARPVRLVADKRTIPSMVVESVSVARDASSTSAWHFAVSLREIRIVSSSLVEAPVPTEVLGAARKARGSQSVKDDEKAVDKESAARKSLAAKGIDGLLSAFSP